MLLILLIAAVALADLAVKSAVEEADPEGFPRELQGTKGMIMVHRDHNEGFPMGVLKDRPELVRQIPLAVLSAVAGIFFWVFPKKGHWAEKIGTSLILGGGLSNLYDRIKRGYVVDYFSIRFKTLQQVIFNLGDICIFLGTAVLLLAEIAETVRER